MNKNCCGNCEYWDNKKFFDKEKGLCKFNAPIFSSDNKTRWPVTREKDWCGRHKFVREETYRNRQYENRGGVKSEPREYESDRR